MSDFLEPTLDNLPEIIRRYYPQFSGIHPACAATPDMDAEDHKNLYESIEKGGLWQPLIRHKDTGMLLDGRNRLLCCYALDRDVYHDDVTTPDPWQYVWDLNVSRRHMSKSQIAMFGNRWRASEEVKAKERQLSGLKKGDVIPVPEVVPERNQDARDAIGAKLGVSGRFIDMARKVEEVAPDLAKEVLAGNLQVTPAYKEACRREKDKESQPVSQEELRVASSTRLVETKKVPLEILPTREQVEIITVDGQTKKVDKPKSVRFNQTNDSVDWANWTWNPVTGCEHGCKFCYAREIANSQRMVDYYPFKFTPSFHEYRLDAPFNTKIPKSNDPRDGRVFVCSMADLFGKWVPDEWIEEVFAACLEAPEWEYLFLTKWPQRYSRMPLLKKAWYGASIIKQQDVKRVEEGMKAFEGEGIVKWVSMEPMLEPIVFGDLSWCDLVVIGAQTSTTQPEGYVPEFSPKFDWIVDVVNQCREQEVPYYLKANVGLDRPGMDLPKMSPRRKK